LKKTRPVLIVGAWAALAAALLFGMFALDYAYYMSKHPAAAFSQWLVGDKR
jgi:hypothetical protein